MQTVNESWARIIAWLESALPEALNNLRPPATAGQIDDAGAALGIRFPESLRALYLLHDGEANNWPPGVFDDGHWFMPLDEMLAHRTSLAEFADEIPADSLAAWKKAIEDHVISVSGPVKPHIYSKRWIPLTSSNGDVNRYLDFDPAPGGQPGQIIEVYPEACSHKVLAPSLETYLQDYADELDADMFVVEHDCIVDTRDAGETDEAMPEYLQAFEPEHVSEADTARAVTSDDLAENDEIELLGRVGTLMGTDQEAQFSLMVANGGEHVLLATRKDTRGFSAISIDQYARIVVKKASPGTPGFLGMWDPADFLVLDFEVVAGPDSPGARHK